MLKSTRPRVAPRGTTGMLFIFSPQQLVQCFTTGSSVLELRHWRLREARPEITPTSLLPLSPYPAGPLPSPRVQIQKKREEEKKKRHSQPGLWPWNRYSVPSSLQLTWYSSWDGRQPDPTGLEKPETVPPFIVLTPWFIKLAFFFFFPYSTCVFRSPAMFTQISRMRERRNWLWFKLWNNCPRLVTSF